jgi:hypothetical protein
MAKKEVLINVTVQATDGINALNRVSKSLNDGAKAASDMGNAVNQALQPIKGSVADLQSQVNALEKVRAATSTTSAEYKRQGIEIDKLNIKIAELSGAKGLGSVNSAAGIAGATVNEFGRFVSDLPFGIIAVTNNLSQMGSLFAILVGQASQLNNGLSVTTNVIRLLKAQFLGPAGILFLFQVAVSAVTFFAQSSRKAEDAVKGLSTGLKEQSTILRDLLVQYNDLGSSQQERVYLLKQIASIDKQLAAALSNQSLSEQERIDLAKQYNDLIDLRIKKDTQYIDTLNRRKEIDLEIAEIDKEIEEQSNRQFTSLEAYRNSLLKIDRLEKERIELEKERKTLNTEIIGLNSRIAASEELIASKLTTGNKALDERIALLRESAKEFKSSQIALLEAQEGGTEEEQVERLNRLRELRAQELKEREEDEINKIEQEGNFLALSLDITETYQNERQILEISHQKALLEIRKEFNKEADVSQRGLVTGGVAGDLNAFKENNDKILSELSSFMARRKEVEENGAKATADLSRKEFENRMIAIQAAQELANGIFDIANANFDKEMTLEQNKTVEMNNQLKERLRNEQLSADERKSIQNQIAQNDEALRKKQEAIEEKRFKLNKAASLANAVVNTYLAATAALKDPALSTFQRIASMVTIIGAGLAQVAVIAKQRFIKSDAGGAPGISAASATTPTAIQAPAFNVVGQSNASQLADVVRGQLDRPVKTYVVASEVTTAQALERNRVNAASI